MTTITQHEAARLSLRSFRPSWRWLWTAAAFPPAGLLAHGVAGRVDDVAPALIGGAITGAVVGFVQWVQLRHRGVDLRWVAATAAAMAGGLAAGAAMVDYRTDRPSLAVMGLLTGVCVGLAQGAAARMGARMALWAGATAALTGLGWIVTASGGIDVDEQWTTFGAYGAITFAFLQSTIIDRFVPKQVTA
jgi:hypothetical protein